MKNEVLKFKSKKGWIIPFVYILFAVAIVLMWVLPYRSEELLMKISATSLIAIVLGIFTWGVFSTYYLLADNFLICVFGPFRTRIFYKDITKIKPSRSWWSSLALSTDRVAIYRGKNFLNIAYISPTFKEFFMKELQKRVDEVASLNSVVNKPIS